MIQQLMSDIQNLIRKEVQVFMSRLELVTREEAKQIALREITGAFHTMAQKAGDVERLGNMVDHYPEEYGDRFPDLHSEETQPQNLRPRKVRTVHNNIHASLTHPLLGNKRAFESPLQEELVAEVALIDQSDPVVASKSAHKVYAKYYQRWMRDQKKKTEAIEASGNNDETLPLEIMENDEPLEFKAEEFDESEEDANDHATPSKVGMIAVGNKVVSVSRKPTTFRPMDKNGKTEITIVPEVDVNF